MPPGFWTAWGVSKASRVLELASRKMDLQNSRFSRVFGFGVGGDRVSDRLPSWRLPVLRPGFFGVAR